MRLIPTLRSARSSWLEVRVSYCRLRPAAASHAASTHAPARVRTHSTLGLTVIANDQSLRFPSHAASTHAPARVRTHSTLGLTVIANDQSLRFLSFMHSPPRCSHHPRISRHARRFFFSSSGFRPFSWPAVLSFFLLRVASAALFFLLAFALRRAPRLPASKNTLASAHTGD